VTTAQTGTKNNIGTAAEQNSGARNERATQMVLINNADAAPSAAEADESRTGRSSDDAETVLARILLQDGMTIPRWFLEKTYRNGKEDGYIAAKVALYLRRSQRQHVPEVLMEVLRGQARVVREEPLDAEEEAYLDEMENALRREIS
jgi:hypothetical protein